MEISSDGSRAADYPQLGEHGKHGFLLRRRRGRSNGWATVVVRGGAGVEGKAPRDLRLAGRLDVAEEIEHR